VLRPLSWNAELLNEFKENLGDFLRLIFMDDMADLVHNDQLEFSLHLCDGKLFVHAVAASKEELLGDSHIKEAFG
jgi:hypothetical protein